MSEELLEALLDPSDDNAWKVAVGFAVRDIREQTRKTNGRVNAHDKQLAAIGGGLCVIGAVVVPLFIKVVMG